MSHANVERGRLHLMSSHLRGRHDDSALADCPMMRPGRLLSGGGHGPTHGAASGCGAQSEIGFGANRRGNILQQSQAAQKKRVLPFRHFRIKSIGAEFAFFTLY